MWLLADFGPILMKICCFFWDSPGLFFWRGRVLQDLKCSHLGRPCILSSVVCFTAEVLSIPQFQFFRLNTNVLLPGPPQTVFYPASVALPLRYIYIYMYMVSVCVCGWKGWGLTATYANKYHQLVFFGGYVEKPSLPHTQSQFQTQPIHIMYWCGIEPNGSVVNALILEEFM